MSAGLLVLNLFIGIGAFYAGKLRYIIRPVIVKFCHNFLGILTFVFGMVSLYFGYYTGFMRRNSNEDIVRILVIFCIATTILSCIGALKALNHQGMDIMKIIKTESASASGDTNNRKSDVEASN